MQFSRLFERTYLECNVDREWLPGGRSVRLTEAQKRVVKAGVKEVFGSDAEVFVFGSRVDDSRHGGRL